MEEIIEIDGSYLEGGGQIVRTSLTLSAITGKPFRIINVRKNRVNPGLAEQHLQCVNAISMLCNAKHNAIKRGTSFEFYPGKIFEKEKFEIKIETAGSIALVISTILPIAYKLYKPIKFFIKGGGTWNRFAPAVLYLQKVLLPLLEKVGYVAEIDINCDGFYPRGGGEVEVIIYPWNSKNMKKDLILENHNVDKIKIYSLASVNLKEKNVAERQFESAYNILKNINLKIEKEVSYVESFSPSSELLIVSSPTILGGDSFGERGKSSEEVGKEASNRFLKEINAKSGVDEHAADQLMIYMALSKSGKLKTSEITNHTKSNAYVIEKFLDVKFKMDENVIEVI